MALDMALDLGGIWDIADGLFNFSDKPDQGDVNYQQEQNYQRQKEFAQMGLQWKVDDAKKAGLSPLFAVGGTGASFSPNPVAVAGNDGGQSISSALTRMSSSKDRALEEAQLALLKAQTDKEFAMSSYYNSEAARNNQAAMQSAPSPLVQGPMSIGAASVAPIAFDHVDMKADPQRSVMSGSPQVGAATNPMFSRFRATEKGGFLDLPYSEEGPSESLEGLWNPVALGLTLYQNLSSIWDRLKPLMSYGNGPFRVPQEDSEYREAISGRHDYPAGRFYRPSPGWENNFRRFRK
nr:MAG: DNA pilot protein [Microvirus sp.]